MHPPYIILIRQTSGSDPGSGKGNMGMKGGAENERAQKMDGSVSSICRGSRPWQLLLGCAGKRAGRPA